MRNECPEAFDAILLILHIAKVCVLFFASYFKAYLPYMYVPVGTNTIFVVLFFVANR